MKIGDQEITAFPLCWPAGRQRSRHRHKANFGKTVQRENETWKRRERLSIEEARTRVSDELRRLSARHPIISSNLELRLDGMPRSNQRQPNDPGIAVYFDLNGPKCIAIDLWDRVEDNLVAVAKSIEAMRGLERWGGGQMVSAVFTGFKSLPGGDAIITNLTVEQAAEMLQQMVAPGSPSVIANILQSRDTFSSCYRTAATRFHPDRNNQQERPEWHTLQRIKEALDKHFEK